jgi:hypothetical protein
VTCFRLGNTTVVQGYVQEDVTGCPTLEWLPPQAGSVLKLFLVSYTRAGILSVERLVAGLMKRKGPGRKRTRFN